MTRKNYRIKYVNMYLNYCPISYEIVVFMRIDAHHALSYIYLWLPGLHEYDALTYLNPTPFLPVSQVLDLSALNALLRPYVWSLLFGTVSFSSVSVLSVPSTNTFSSNPKSPIKRRKISTFPSLSTSILLTKRFN